jgi:DNA-binding response OmpR family regulator
MPKILIVDDNIDFSDMVSSYFLASKYDVKTTDNPAEAAEIAKFYRPDVILLDVMMPEKGGIEVIKELEYSEETAGIPVIILTSTFYEKNIVELFKMESNCMDFLSKTTPLDLLKKKIENIIKDKKS